LLYEYADYGSFKISFFLQPKHLNGDLVTVIVVFCPLLFWEKKANNQRLFPNLSLYKMNSVHYCILVTQRDTRRFLSPGKADR